MNLLTLATEVGNALDTVTPAGKLRVYRFGAEKIEAPAAIVTMPDTYRRGGQGGARMLEGLGVLLCVRATAAGRPRRNALAALYGYLGDTGTGSIVSVVEGAAYTACVPGTMAWQRTSFDVVRIGGADYLAALIEFNAAGVAT